MQQLSGKLTKTLLTISENQYQFTMHRVFKYFKVLLYFFQLQGYVFSQYETKPLQLFELNYLANFTQLSAITFALSQLGNDALTTLVFYFFFIIHILMYVQILVISIFRKKDKKQLNTFETQWYAICNFIFLNFQWIFLTPFQEISIGMIVCGDNAFLTSQKQSNCFNKIPIIHYIIAITGTIMVSFTGFVSNYFFRSYQFNKNDFLRKYKLKNMIIIFIHQVIIICYYLNLSSLDYIKHTLMHILLFVLLFEALTDFPFLFYQESKFYTCLVACNEWFMLILSIWLFSDLDSKFIWLTFLLFLPLIISLSLSMLNILNQRLLANFNMNRFNPNADTYLEEIYRIGSQFYHSVDYKVKYMLTLKQHIVQCKHIHCPCKLNCQLFLDSTNNVNWKHLSQWSQFIFGECLKNAFQSQQYYYYENFSLKFNTFLETYQNNPVLAFGILQDIMVLSTKTRFNQNISISFYFKNLFLVLNQNNIQKIIQLHSGYHTISEQEYHLLEDQNLLLSGSHQLLKQLKSFLMKSIQLWQNYSSQTFENEQELSFVLRDTYQLKFDLEQKIIKFIEKSRPSIFLVRTFLLINISINANLKAIGSLQKVLSHLIIEEQNDVEGIFKSIKFDESSAISVAIHISPQTKGKLFNLRTNKLIFNFFGYKEFDETIIKSIEHFMPDQIAEIHPYLIDNYVQQGQSKHINCTFPTYFKNGRGFLEKISICLNIFFPIDLKEPSHLLIGHIIKQQNQIGQTRQQNKNQEKGYILLGKNFEIIGYDELTFTKLQQLNTKQKNITTFNIFSMMPTLAETASQYYKRLISKNLFALENIEIGQSFDQLSLSYQSQSVKTITKQKDMYSNKERLKSIQKQSYNQTNTQASYSYIDIHYTISQQILSYQMSQNAQIMPFYIIDIKYMSQQAQRKQHSSKQQASQQQDLKKYCSDEQLNHQQQFNQQLQSSYASYRSSLSFHQILQQFYLYTIAGLKEIQVQIIGSFLILIICCLFPFIIVEQTKNEIEAQQDAINQIYQYSSFLNEYNNIIICQIHQLEIEQYYNKQNNFQQIQNNTVLKTLIYEDLINITNQQTLSISKTIQQIYQDVDFTFAFSQSNNQIYSYLTNELVVKQQQINQLGIIYQIINTNLNDLLEIINSDSEIERYLLFQFRNNIRYSLIQNYDPFQYVSLILQDQFKLMQNQNYLLYIFYSFYYFSVCLFFGIQILSQIRIENKKMKILKLFQLIDYGTACEQLKESQIKLKIIKSQMIWLDVPKLEIINQQFANQLEELTNVTFKEVHQEAKQLKLKDLTAQRKNKLQNYFLLLGVSCILIFQMIFIQIYISVQDRVLDTQLQQQASLIDLKLNLSMLIMLNEAKQLQGLSGSGIVFDIANMNQTIQRINFSFETFKDQTFEALFKMNTDSGYFSEDPCTFLICIIQPYQSRLYGELMVEYFKLGLINSLGVTLQTLEGNNNIQIKTYNEILTDSNYFIYLFWGYDLIDYQFKLIITEFINTTKNNIALSIQNIQQWIYLINFIVFFISFGLLLIQTYQQRNGVNLIKGSLSLIPSKIILSKKLNTMIKTI